eukprot:1157869-Pelagomonas_calceolata.AAC.2
MPLYMPCTESAEELLPNNLLFTESACLSFCSSVRQPTVHQVQQKKQERKNTAQQLFGPQTHTAGRDAQQASS